MTLIIYYRSLIIQTSLFGKICQLLHCQSAGSSLAVLERFCISNHLHEIFDMPVLTQRFDEAEYIVVKTTVSSNYHYSAQADPL